MRLSVEEPIQLGEPGVSNLQRAKSLLLLWPTLDDTGRSIVAAAQLVAMLLELTRRSGLLTKRQQARTSLRGFDSTPHMPKMVVGGNREVVMTGTVIRWSGAGA